LKELPALLFVGPRACGKTTSAARLARTVVRLDRPADAMAFQADPDAALRGLEEPVLLDEWQAVPEVLGAVKRSVDRDARAGRYVLTGSVRADLEAQTWPGTGRLVRLSMGPMTVGERTARATRPVVDRVAEGEALVPASEPCDLRDYVELALRSGFPAATLMSSDSARERWLTSYVEQLITRDALDLEASRDPARLRKYFEAYALNTAGIVEDKTLFEAAGVNRKTAAAYERLLTKLLVVEALPAWSSNRLKRLTARPKRHLVDVGLLTGATGIDAGTVMKSGDLLGRVLESFVVAHLRAEAAVAKLRPRLYHLRTEQGRQEIDVLDPRSARDEWSRSRSRPRAHRRLRLGGTSPGCETRSASASSRESSCTQGRAASDSANASRRRQSAACGNRPSEASRESRMTPTSLHRARPSAARLTGRVSSSRL
jgi:hypothetical protein